MLAFATAPDQVGALFAINGRIVGLDLFHSPATMSKLLSKLVRSNAFDAIDAKDADGEQKASLTRDDAARFLHRIAAANVQRFPAIAEGEDVRLTAPGLTGGALIADTHLMHLGAFQLEDVGGEHGSAVQTAM